MLIIAATAVLQRMSVSSLSCLALYRGHLRFHGVSTLHLNGPTDFSIRAGHE